MLPPATSAACVTLRCQELCPGVARVAFESPTPNGRSLFGRKSVSPAGRPRALRIRGACPAESPGTRRWPRRCAAVAADQDQAARLPLSSRTSVMYIFWRHDLMVGICDLDGGLISSFFCTVCAGLLLLCCGPLFCSGPAHVGLLSATHGMAHRSVGLGRRAPVASKIWMQRIQAYESAKGVELSL